MIMKVKDMQPKEVVHFNMFIILIRSWFEKSNIPKPDAYYNVYILILKDYLNNP